MCIRDRVGASEGVRFAEIMNDVSKKIKELGPIGQAEGIEPKKLAFKLEAVNNIVPYMRLVERERMRINLNSEEEYRKFYSSEEFDELFKELITDKLAVSEIMLLLREGPRSGEEISEILGLKPSEVSKHLNLSARQGLLRFDESQRVVLPQMREDQARA